MDLSSEMALLFTNHGVMLEAEGIFIINDTSCPQVKMIRDQTYHKSQPGFREQKRPAVP